MAVFETWLKSDLKKPVVVQKLAGNLFSADNGGNKIGVEIFDDGASASVTGGVTGYIVRDDNATVVVTGTLSGNKASIILPQSAYTVVGNISIVIKVGTTTVGACVGYVYRTTTDTMVDPGHVIPSLEELLAKIAACEQATTNANTAASSANTAASSANTAASNANTKASLADTAASNADSKAALANTAAGSANTAASAANTAASKIDGMTVAASALPSGSTPTATISEVSGHKHIAFGLVNGAKGDKGDPGKDFHIAKTFSSVSAMMNYTGTDIEAYDFAMIDTGSVQDVDTGKLYCYEPDKTPKWQYIGDLSGAQGIKGETGTGIDHIVLNQDYTLTIYLDDETSYTTASIRGATGATPAISIGTVTTLTPSQNAYVQLDQSSTPEAPVFNFGIPKGETGTVENMYGSTIPMSPQDGTKIETALNGKVDANQGAVNAGKALGIDNTGAVVPVPFSGEDFTGATASTAGVHGYVPAPAAGDQGKFLKGDGSWGNVPNPQVMTGATSSTDGASGLVPAPSAGDQGKSLFGDGTWKQVADPADVSANSSAITNLSSVTNSNSNSTKDIIADALACTRTKFFYGAGANYTGTVPDANYKYGTFIVNVRGDDRHIIAQSGTGDFATNSYRNGWSGWKVVADASELGDISTLITPNKASAVNAINWLATNKPTFIDVGIMDANHRTFTVTMQSEVAIVLGAYGSSGFMYLIHRGGGSTAVLANSAITISFNGNDITISNSGTSNYRLRVMYV